MPDDRTIVLKPIKWYKKLATRKGRLESEAFLIEGERTIKQIISNNPDDIIEIVSTEELSPFYQKYSKRIVTDSQYSRARVGDQQSSQSAKNAVLLIYRVLRKTRGGKEDD